MTDTPPPVTDTPVPQPASRVDAIKALVGDLSRPVGLLAVCLATAFLIVWAALTRWDGAAGVIAAAGVILLGMWAAKSTENAIQANASARVEKAKVESPHYPNPAEEPKP